MGSFSSPIARRLGQRHAFVVAGLTFLSLLVAAGLRAAPSVLMLPLQGTFGWSRSTVSVAAAVGIFPYGLVGPFAAALMQTIGAGVLGVVAALAMLVFSSATIDSQLEIAV